MVAVINVVTFESMIAEIDRKLSEQVVDRLEAMIREGTYEPGSHLPPERELMDLFGVGRPSVREAMIALETGARDEALAILRALVNDQDATAGLRQRVGQLIVVLDGNARAG